LRFRKYRDSTLDINYSAMRKREIGNIAEIREIGER